MVVGDFLDLIDRNEAIIALTYVLDISRSQVLLNLDKEVEKKDEDVILEIFSKRNKGVPLQYAIGKWNFYGRDFLVKENVLIPRSETELLVEEVLKYESKNKNVLDLCTGTGIIGITLSLEGEYSKVVISDISEYAYALSKKNANRYNVNVEVIQSDLFENIEGSFSYITANPPYIKTDILKTLSEDVKKEPRVSLDGGIDGLYIYRRIIKDAKNYLEEDGKLIFEIGFDQREELMKLLEDFGYTNIKVIKDYNDFDRVIVCERGNNVWEFRRNSKTIP